MYYVYELVNLLGTVEYVGQTKDPSYRLLQHKSKPNNNGAGKFHKRQDISMHIVATYKTEKEATTWLKTYLKVDSRADIAKSQQAVEKMLGLKQEFASWKARTD